MRSMQAAIREVAMTRLTKTAVRPTHSAAPRKRNTVGEGSDSYVYESLICGQCGQIVRTDDAGKARRHMTNDGKRRCKGGPA